MPLNPYLRSKIVNHLLKALKPKQIRLYPSDMIFDGEQEILERTVLLNWMRQWLQWLLWYCRMLMLNGEVSLMELLDAPVCSTSWKRQNFDPNRVKFGLIWKCWDSGAGWTLQSMPSNLKGLNTTQYPKWKLGGRSGNDFLLAPPDSQPGSQKEKGRE